MFLWSSCVRLPPRHLGCYAASSVRVVKIMAKLRWGNGETNTGGNPYVVERGVGSDLQYYDRTNVKDSKREPYISFEELSKKFNTDPKHLLNALKNRNVIIENPSDMLTRQDTDFILHTFSSSYKEEAKEEDRTRRAEERRKVSKARDEKTAELASKWNLFSGKSSTEKDTYEKYKDLLD